jgi:hypothetical protein
MISDERSFRLTTKIELVEVRELTESTDWFLPFHLLHRYCPERPRRWAPTRRSTAVPPPHTCSARTRLSSLQSHEMRSTTTAVRKKQIVA